MCDARKRHILIILLAVCIGVIAVLTGIRLISDRSAKDSENFEMSGKTVSLKTPYCTLEYPAEAYKMLKCVDKTEDGVYSKVFYGIIDDTEIELFEVAFGVKEDASLIGYIIHNNEKCPVFVRSAEVDDISDRDLQNTIYMMQEGINSVIDSITSNENFSVE